MQHISFFEFGMGAFSGTPPTGDVLKMKAWFDDLVADHSLEPIDSFEIDGQQLQRLNGSGNVQKAQHVYHQLLLIKDTYLAFKSKF